MTDDLDTLRPELREAVQELDGKTYSGSRTHLLWQIIRAELLRLAAENAAARGALETLDVEGHKRAERAEAELAAARETIKRLNRRVQVAEAGIAEKVKASAPGSLGRALANAAADKYMRERDMAQAELAALKAKTQWQPIETAPHAQNVLLFCPHRHESNPQRIEVGAATWGELIGHRSNGGAHAWATHWMPLPEPPAERGEG